MRIYVECVRILIVFYLEIGNRMYLQGLTSLEQVHNSTLEAFTQAALILILAVAIVASNVLIIATIVNFRGK